MKISHRGLRGERNVLVAALAVLGIAGALETASAGVTGAPRTAALDGFTWKTMGDLDNRPINQSNVINIDAEGQGGVDHFYRISDTVVTVGQWFEFLQAYTPFQEHSSRRDNQAVSDLTTITIGMANFPQEPGKIPIYRIGAGVNPNNPALGMSWRNAARYVNWLNNGKALTLNAFEGGVCDITACDRADCFPQLTHNPEAQIWLPTASEMIKAAYWEPNKNGVGNGGYWQYPDGSDTPLVSGRPGEPGAQTQAGPTLIEFFQALPVRSYPDTQTP